MATTLARQLQLRGSDTDWTANSSIVPLYGEVCLETDGSFVRIKVGDGARNFGALPYIGWDQVFTFATQSQVQAGVINNLPVAPDTLAATYPQKTATSNPEIVQNTWSFNNAVTFSGYATIVNEPRSGAPGVRDAVGRGDLDNRFTSTATSQGAADSGKAPILDSTGRLTLSALPINALPVYRGLFDPVLGTPQLINQTGGGILPVAGNGDYFVASDTGLYDFFTGNPGSGVQVNTGDTILWDNAAELWNVVAAGGTNIDAGAVRQNPTTQAENTITPQSDFPNLLLKGFAGQTKELLQIVDANDTNLFQVFPDGQAIMRSLYFHPITITPADPISNYPFGYSTSTPVAQGAWPIFGTVTTQNLDNASGYQQIENGERILFRRFLTGSWSAWSEYAALDSPTFVGNPTVPDLDAADNSASILNSRSNIARDAKYGAGEFLYIDSSFSLTMTQGTNYDLLAQISPGDVLYDGTSGGYSGNGVTFPDVGQYGFHVILYGSTNASFKSEDSGLINQNLLMVPWDTSGSLPAPSPTSYVRTYPIENEVATSTAYDFNVIQTIDSPPTNPVGLAISAFYLNISEYGTFTMDRAIIVGYQLQRGAAGLTW